VAVLGVAVEFLPETFRRALVGPCLAVDGENKRQGCVVQVRYVADMVGRLTPAGVFAMVAVKDEKGTGIDRVVDLQGIPSGPSAERAGGLRNVSQAVRSEIIDNRVRVGCR